MSYKLWDSKHSYITKLFIANTIVITYLGWSEGHIIQKKTLC